jgi:exosortase H (IPTLxxWG-CTERM-specific)
MMITVPRIAAPTVTKEPQAHGHRTVLVFLARFVALMALAYSLTIIPWFQQVVFPLYLRFNAMIAESVLNVIGEQVHRTDLSISSDRFALQVQRGCDAMEPTMLFVAAVFAFPATWRQRGAGALAGAATLLALNIVRIVSLFLIGAYAPALFDSVHLEIWQVVFIMLTILLWTTWAWLVSTRDSKKPDAFT